MNTELPVPDPEFKSITNPATNPQMQNPNVHILKGTDRNDVASMVLFFDTGKTLSEHGEEIIGVKNMATEQFQKISDQHTQFIQAEQERLAKKQNKIQTLKAIPIIGNIVGGIYEGFVSKKLMDAGKKLGQIREIYAKIMTLPTNPQSKMFNTSIGSLQVPGPGLSEQLSRTSSHKTIASNELPPVLKRSPGSTTENTSSQLQSIHAKGEKEYLQSLVNERIRAQQIAAQTYHIPQEPESTPGAKAYEHELALQEYNRSPSSKIQTPTGTPQKTQKVPPSGVKPPLSDELGDATGKVQSPPNQGQRPQSPNATQLDPIAPLPTNKEKSATSPLGQSQTKPLEDTFEQDIRESKELNTLKGKATKIINEFFQ